MVSPSSAVYSLGELPPIPGWHLPAHRHRQFHQLIVVLDGAMRLRTPTEELVARNGDVLFYPAGLLHEENSLPKEPVHTLYFDFEWGSYGAEIPLRQPDRDGRVRQMAGWLRHDLGTGRSASDCRPLFAALLAEVSRLAAGPPPDPWVQAVRARFQRDLAANHSLADAARQAGMSPFAFLRKFKKLAGRTPMADLRLLRLHAACQRLRSSDAPLKAVAPSVGLGDEFQLSRLFRRHFGISPSRFRASFR